MNTERVFAQLERDPGGTSYTLYVVLNTDNGEEVGVAVFLTDHLIANLRFAAPVAARGVVQKLTPGVDWEPSP